MKFHTWLITLSPREDIDRTCAEEVVKYLKCKCRYGYVVLEHAAKWHLHAAVCFKSPIEKKHFEATIWSKIEKFHSSSIKRIALKSTVQFNHDWHTQYLQKDSNRIVIWNKYDIDDYSKFFPTEEEQVELQLAKDAKAPMAAESVDPYYARLEREWEEYSPEVSYEEAVKFLQYSMYVSRTARVISDQRRLHQTAFALFKYRAHDISLSVEAVRYGHLMDGTISQT